VSKHIGIVACSAEGAALCYTTICIEAPEMLQAYAHPEISMHTHSFADYAKYLDRGDLQGVAELMLSSAAKLANAGAEFLICPDNTIHQAMHLVEPRSPLPWLHIADTVSEEAVRRGYRRVGLLGTRWLVTSEVYPEKLRTAGVEFLRPAHDKIDEMHRIIMDELVYGKFDPASIAYCAGVIERFKRQACDAVILGCTELPLILNDGNSPLPTLDSTRLLARAALAKALSPSYGAPSPIR
jgi:aspartate racemase